MRKSILVTLALIFSLFSCGKNPDAAKMMKEFREIYPTSGVIYTPLAKEGDEGFITEELFRKIYIFEGKLPEKFAILLNYHSGYSAECGVFVCDGSDERERIIEMCAERIRLLEGGSDIAFISVTGDVVFYSTVPDKARAEAIWRKIVRAHLT